MKAHGSTVEMHWILLGLSAEEVRGILGVRVKSVDIERNTRGEGASLVGY